MGRLLWSEKLAFAVRLLVGFLLGGVGPTVASASETNTYTYDALGRLVAASTNKAVGASTSTAMTYDPAGNRANYTVSTGSPPPPPPPPTNHPPTANSDNAGTMGKCTAKVVNVTANDTDPDGDPLTVISATASGDMSATVVSASSVEIDSGATAGAKSISYTISDGRGGTSSSTISVTVSAGVCN